jgi:hypothetical protein
MSTGTGYSNWSAGAEYERRYNSMECSRYMRRGRLLFARGDHVLWGRFEFDQARRKINA